jgi:hypothetical protein
MIPILSSTTIKQLNLWINPDIDSTMIDQATVNVQRSLIRETLGYPYFENIYNQFINNSGNTTGYTASDQYIMDNYINDVIAFGVANEILPTLFGQLNQDGLRLITSSQSVIAPDKLISMYQQIYQSKINERRIEMVKYMDKNRSSYPLYFGHFGGSKNSVATFPIHRAGRNRGFGRWF